MMINGERVRQARELRGMTQAALAKFVGVSQAAIAQIEAGIFLASDNLLHEISRRTKQPLRFFGQEPAPEFPVGSLLFRSHGAMTKGELNLTYRNAQFAYDVYTRLRGKLRSLPVKIPMMPGIDPATAARETRRILGIPFDAPIPHLLNVLEWSGVIAVVVPHIKSSEAFSLWFNGSPVLSLSSDRSGDRARLSVAHELGHLTLHAGKSRFEVDDFEADDFAAEFLMPEVVITKELRPPVTLSSLATLKSRWRVSIQALIRRAKDVGVISERQYKYLFEQLSAMGWRKQEPVEIAPEQPRALRQMAEMLYGDPIDFHAMAHELALDVDDLRRMMEYFATKSEGSTAPSNVVSLTRSRRR
jgi:Zn-dependent peptidase ImmA (M78 family)/DNA-binding XRE family transcriptional regulator